MNRRTLCLTAVALMGLVAATFSSSAQERQGGDRERGGDRGNFDPAQFRERMMTELKDRLSATDEEWTVLKPKIEKVQTAQMSAAGGRFGGMFRGNRGGDSNRQRSAAEQASRDLRDALENKDTPPETITAKLTALREARAKAKAELETAQKDLQAVLTPRQEAVLVSSGTLD